jgi:CRP-like cAMP-binding protein
MNSQGLFEHAPHQQEYQPGSTIFAEGTDGQAMYVILDGEVDLRVGGELMETAGPGDIIGEMALIDANPRSATATARSRCLLAAVDQARFLYLVQETPYFALHVMRLLAHRLRRMNREWSTLHHVAPPR